MSEQVKASGWYRASATPADLRPRLKFDMDADICVIGGGIAGVSAALEAARLGATVALIEARQIGWNASGASLGIVTPGFGNSESDIVARLGRHHARELWTLSQEGVDRIREIAGEIQNVGITDGALDVSTTGHSDDVARRMQVLVDDLGADVESWPADQVRGVLKAPRYFHGIHHPRAFHLHALNYLKGLAELAQRAGVQIFEQTDVTSIDATGIRKRIVTPEGRLRANAIIVAGNVHLGKLFPRLVKTLRPVWRYAAVTEPLGDRLADAVSFAGAVSENGDGSRFRVVGGDRLMWSGPVRWHDVAPRRLRGAIQSEIAQAFPTLKPVAIADIWSGVTGETVHGMPQIGQMNHGLWIAGGFGRQGFNTAAMAGRLIARGILAADDRWRLFAPYELVWAGGLTGRLVGHATHMLIRNSVALAGFMARRRDRAKPRTPAGAAPEGPALPPPPDPTGKLLPKS